MMMMTTMTMKTKMRKMIIRTVVPVLLMDTMVEQWILKKLTQIQAGHRFNGGEDRILYNIKENLYIIFITPTSLCINIECRN